ncbi:hypothetical protein Lesp02_03790 [Lentzea sp. NBRC 105346]|nr:hypothetical protein Lesp02_03790 [Lentzea sp. NBRC 105346]
MARDQPLLGERQPGYADQQRKIRYLALWFLDVYLSYAAVRGDELLAGGQDEDSPEAREHAQGCVYVLERVPRSWAGVVGRAVMTVARDWMDAAYFPDGPSGPPLAAELADAITPPPGAGLEAAQRFIRALCPPGRQEAAMGLIADRLAADKAATETPLTSDAVRRQRAEIDRHARREPVAALHVEAAMAAYLFLQPGFVPDRVAELQRLGAILGDLGERVRGSAEPEAEATTAVPAALGGTVPVWQAAWAWAEVLTGLPGMSAQHQTDEVKVLLARAISIAAARDGLLPVNRLEPLESVTALETLSLTVVQLRHLKPLTVTLEFVDSSLGVTPTAGDPGHTAYCDLHRLLTQDGLTAQEIVEHPAAFATMQAAVDQWQQYVRRAGGVITGAHLHIGPSDRTEQVFLAQFRPELARHLALADPDAEPAPGVPELWRAAQAWGTELAGLALQGPPGFDHRATAGIIALAAYALALRHQVTDVRQVGVDRLAVPLFDGEKFDALVRSELGAAGHQLDEAVAADPVSLMWAWLHRTWPVDEVTGELTGRGPDWPPRWSIGGHCAPRPLIEVYLQRAAGGADRVLSAERNALPRSAKVVVVGGQHAGKRGFVEFAAWRLTGGMDQVEPGPPPAYYVNLGEIPGGERVDFLVEPISAADLELGHDVTDERQPDTP